jgi:hypothetical protein
VLELDATNLASLTVDPTRAHLDCNARVEVKTDGPVRVMLAGCGRTITTG